MSSLAAARADGFYYGPDYDPKTHGSLNSYRGSHPLGDRAKDIHLGILVIRFEMPFKVSCLSCNTIVDKGVRFNAKKQKTGCYFSTPVYSFSFQCPECNNPFIITTDPKRARYLCTRGLRQRQEDAPDPSSGNPRLIQPEERGHLDANPLKKREEILLLRRQRGLMLKREHEQQLAAEETPQQQQLRERITRSRIAAAQLLQQQQADDYAANRRMREQLQQRKRAAAAAATAAGGESDGEDLKGICFRKKPTTIDKLASQLAKTHASIFPKHKRDFSTICKSDAVALRLANAASSRKRNKINTKRSNNKGVFES